MLCLEDGQKARDITCNMTSGYQQSLVFHYLDTFPKPPFVPDWPAQIPDFAPADLEEAIAAGLTVTGTPEECDKAVQAYVETGADQLAFGQLSTTMPIEIALESLDTFGKHVLPKYDKDPIHSTRRQREEYVAKHGPTTRTLADVLDEVPV
jgi:alkanesulfonate monooxygenase SsuD/methylene tetrahydromethanopterin reductase-like flavin-dependent oxidoreductase (luciferase family)